MIDNIAESSLTCFKPKRSITLSISSSLAKISSKTSLAAFCEIVPSSILFNRVESFALLTGLVSMVTPFFNLPKSSTVSQVTHSFGEFPPAIRSSKYFAIS